MEPAVADGWFSCPPQASQGRKRGLAPKMTIGGSYPGFRFAPAGRVSENPVSQSPAGFDGAFSEVRPSMGLVVPHAGWMPETDLRWGYAVEAKTESTGAHPLRTFSPDFQKPTPRRRPQKIVLSSFVGKQTLNGQGDLERGSLARLALDSDVPVMLVYDLANCRQTYAHGDS